MAIKRHLKKFFTVKNTIITVAVVVALVAVSWMYGPELYDFFSDSERVKALIKTAGPLGPIIYVLLQALQIIFAPVPGNIVGTVGGVAFGWWGLPLTIIGSILGMMGVVAISRRFGRPILEKFFSKKDIKKFDWILEHDGAPLILFLIFLFPFMPKDLVGYLSGLTNIRYRNIIIISAVGKLPLQVLTNFFGAKLLAGNFWIVAVLLVVLAAMGVAIYFKRGWLMKFVQSPNHKQFLKDSISGKNKVKSKNVSKNNSK